jgi:hypothetical protein
MDTLKTYAVEAISAVWLAIVAVQYLSRYFIAGLEKVDFTFAYVGMLILMLASVVFRLFGKKE